MSLAQRGRVKLLHTPRSSLGEHPAQCYLDEFVFCFDRRWQETELFIRVLEHATRAALGSDHQLTAERVA